MRIIVQAVNRTEEQQLKLFQLHIYNIIVLKIDKSEMLSGIIKGHFICKIVKYILWKDQFAGSLMDLQEKGHKYIE